MPVLETQRPPHRRRLTLHPDLQPKVYPRGLFEPIFGIAARVAQLCQPQDVALMATLWIMLPGFMLTVAMSIYYVPAKFVSLPHKEYWLAPERKESTRRALGNRMAWLPTIMALFLVALNHDVIVANLSTPPRAPDNLGWIAGAFVAVTFAWTSETYWRFRRPSHMAADL